MPEQAGADTSIIFVPPADGYWKLLDAGIKDHRHYRRNLADMTVPKWLR
jgi:hypothetical protein